MSSGAQVSTVALGIYNRLAIEGSSLTAEQLLERQASAHAGLEQAEVDAALAELVTRHLAAATDGAYRLTDAVRRPVVSRDAGGDGWSGWMVLTSAGQRVAVGS